MRHLLQTQGPGVWGGKVTITSSQEGIGAVPSSRALVAGVQGGAGTMGETQS